MKKDLRPSWLNSAWFKERGVVAKNPFYSSRRELLKEALHNSLAEEGLPQLLRYEDRNSMAFSIESRVPFLTPALVNFVFSLPEEYLLTTDGTTKAVFRKAMRGIVPSAILDRRDKIGFATPEKDWLLALRPWVRRVLASEAAEKVQVLNVKEVQREWEGISQGDKPFDSRVWRWVNLIVWSQKFSVRLE
jgi:asparagine synthase (glutamine-hydrolysing)